MSKDVGTIGYSWERIKTWPKYHTLYKNLGTASKWIIHPSVKHKITKLFRKNIKDYLRDLGLDKKNFDMTPKAWSINKRISSKLKICSVKDTVCSVKDTVKRRKRINHRNDRKYIFIKRLCSEYNKLSRLSRKKTVQMKTGQ